MQGSDTISALTGAVLGGRYHLLRLIKAGGMGAVYEARDIKLERPVAVKILSPELTQQPGMVRRLFREARAASQVRHPNIVEYLDYDQIPDGPAYLVMEMLDGGDLERVLKQRGPIAWPVLAPWLREACRALSAAHAAGIIHRDIKPSNFVLAERPGVGGLTLKLVDFGIVKLTPLSGLRGDTEMTQHLLGTEMFMAPELFSGATPNPRTEVYALGVSIYRLLTGKYPRSETSEPPPPSYFCPNIPPEVDALVSKCLSVHPLTRFDSMDALDAEIHRTLVGEHGVVAPPPVRVTAPSISAPTLAAPLRTSRWFKFTMVIVGSMLIVSAFAFWPSSEAPGGAAIEVSHIVPSVSPSQPSPTSKDGTIGGDAGEGTETGATTEVGAETGDSLRGKILDGPKEVEPVEPVEPVVPFSVGAARKLLDTLAVEAKMCGERENLPPHSTLGLTIRIAPSGRARATANPATLGHAKCIVKLVNALSFARSTKGGKISYSYRL